MSLRPRGTVCTAPRGRLLLHPRRTGSRPRPSDGRRSPAPSRTAGRFRPNGRTPALSPACNCLRMGLLPCFLLFPSDGCGLIPALPRQARPRLALPSPHRARAEPAPGGAEVCFSLSWDILRWLRSQGLPPCQRGCPGCSRSRGTSFYDKLIISQALEGPQIPNTGSPYKRFVRKYEEHKVMSAAFTKKEEITLANQAEVYQSELT